MIRTVFFDAAGTLLEVAEPVGETYARFARIHGLRVDAAVLQRSFLAAVAQSPPLAFPDAASADLAECERAWWRRIVVTTFERASVEGEGSAVERTFDAVFAHFAMPQAWTVFGDVRPTLERLRTLGLRLAVVSNFDRRLRRLLEALDLAAAFDAQVLSSECGFAKPDPRIFEFALQATASRADETLHVGDSERLDVRGAHAAGLTAVWLDRAGHGGGATIHSLAALPQRLSR